MKTRNFFASPRKLLMAMAVVLAPVGIAHAQSVQVPGEGTESTLETLNPETHGYETTGQYEGAQGRAGDSRTMDSGSTYSERYHEGARGRMGVDKNRGVEQSRRTSIQVQEGLIETLRTLAPEIYGVPRQSAMGDPTNYGNYPAR